MPFITTEPIDFTAVTNAVRSHRAGAVVLFMGTVREFTNEAVTTQLTYESFAEMADVQMQKLADQAQKRWSLCHLKMVHRTGKLDLGDIAVAVAVSAPHRDAAFESGRWLLDEIKKSVPIWKQEHFADGSTEWQHPVGGVPASDLDSRSDA
ncbi:MAG: molybdenum cofactor biosynthesis protein MoaE [Fuerstiella sp.]